MISLKLQIMSLIGLIFYFCSIIYLLRKKSISLKYTLMWIISGITMIVVVIFPKLLIGITSLLGIQVASNALFGIVIFFILLILMSLTGIVTGLNEKNKRLVQTLAILEKRVRELENEKNHISNYCNDKHAS